MGGRTAGCISPPAPCKGLKEEGERREALRRCEKIRAVGGKEEGILGPPSFPAKTGPADASPALTAARGNSDEKMSRACGGEGEGEEGKAKCATGAWEANDSREIGSRGRLGAMRIPPLISLHTSFAPAPQGRPLGHRSSLTLLSKGDVQYWADQKPQAAQ